MAFTKAWKCTWSAPFLHCSKMATVFPAPLDTIASADGSGCSAPKRLCSLQAASEELLRFRATVGNIPATDMRLLIMPGLNLWTWNFSSFIRQEWCGHQACAEFW